MGLHPRRAATAKVARTDAIAAGADDVSWNTQFMWSYSRSGLNAVACEDDPGLVIRFPSGAYIRFSRGLFFNLHGAYASAVDWFFNMHYRRRLGIARS